MATIDKFSFSSDGNASAIGDLTETLTKICGQSSPTHGYTTGGTGSRDDPEITADKTNIEKFSFASDGDASQIAELTTPRDSLTGTSSLDYGYAAGGFYRYKQRWDDWVDVYGISTIDKFSFASDANSVDSGNLTTSDYMYAAAGQQS